MSDLNDDKVKSIEINNSVYLRIPKAFVKVFKLRAGEIYKIEFKEEKSKRTILFRLTKKKK